VEGRRRIIYSGDVDSRKAGNHEGKEDEELYMYIYCGVDRRKAGNHE